MHPSKEVTIGTSPTNLNNLKGLQEGPDLTFNLGIQIFVRTTKEIVDAPGTGVSEELIDRLGNSFLPASLLLPSSQPIRETAEHLNQVLKSPDSSVGSPHSKPFAAAISDAMIHQVSLPMRRKYTSSPTATEGAPIGTAVRINEGLQSELLMQFDTNNDDSAFKELKKSVGAYTSDMSGKIIGLIDADEIELKAGIEKVNPALDALSTDLVQDLDVYSSPSFINWKKLFAYNFNLEVAQNPNLHRLFTSGQLENLSLYRRTLLWTVLTTVSDPNTPLKDDPIMQSVWDYYSSHPDIRDNFWLLHARMDPKDLILKTDSPSLVNNGRFLEWAILQEPSTSIALMDTLDFNNISPEERNNLLDHMWGITAALKFQHELNPNINILVDKLTAQGQTLTPGKYDATESILKDERPGVLYLNFKGEVQPADPTDSPTKMYEQLIAKGARLLYVSSNISGWDQVIRPDPEPKTKKEVIQIPAISECNIPGIGKVLETDPESAGQVLRTLAKKINYPTPHFIGLEQMTKLPKPDSNDTQILFPGILPDTHPLSALDSAGVVAIARKGADVDVIINPDRTGIEVDTEKRNLALHGEVIGHDRIKEKGQPEIADTRTLVMEGTLNRFAYFKLDQLVQAALGYLANPNEANGFSQSNISEARRIVKQWKAIARTNNLPPTLSFLDNPLKRDPDSAHALIRANGQDGFLKID